MVYRVYVEKKEAYAVEAGRLKQELITLLGISGLNTLRIINRYDLEGVSEELFAQCIPTVFSEPPVDRVYKTLPEADFLFAVEYLPGQFDQRADSAAECIQLISQGERPLVRSAKVYLFNGAFTGEQKAEIEKYLINPVEARKASLEEKTSLLVEYPAPPDVKILDGFKEMGANQRAAFIEKYALAMDGDDLAFCQQYFRKENREPSMTELRMIDTYWSDHCRHTTFGTILDKVEIQDEKVQQSYDAYIKLREELYSKEKQAVKPVTLMDMGTIGAKALKARGILTNLDESDEINACSVHMQVDNGGKEEDWLLLFKNETHNHPTEIEPFGGAATCIGGAIRDPLANRGYVFGAMRVTGAADPLVPVQDTLPGKLPQRKLVTTAAKGYSSYGNQIGLATGQVTELYHPGYMAKRMEVGAVLGAVPLKNVRREEPQPGDIVLLLGGRTGRDGCGGATGSSKAHKLESLENCGAEVQKGNPPVERKLQRLFRNPEASLYIRRCNDFGAGGVSVAIGELADGLRINLDAVPKKYDGLDGTELAISESQERMAVVVEAKDVPRFIELAHQENLEATEVAVITEEPRLVMDWRGETIVDISREFLACNGAEKHAHAKIASLPEPVIAPPKGETLKEKMENLVQDLNVCSQKGLSEEFDSTIGSASVLMPFGGKYQLTPNQAMVLKIPVEDETTTCAGMAFGFNPYISEQNPYLGAKLAVYESVAKLAANGFSLKNISLSFQEYFERLREEPARWGKPVSSLLGALDAQLALGVAAIGGKDSMSGSFEELDVPPTLLSFAVAAGKVERAVSPEFELPSSPVVWLRPASAGGILPSAAGFKMVLTQLEKLIGDKKVLSVYAVGAGGLGEALFKMSLGNRVGVRLADDFVTSDLFRPAYGSFVLEMQNEAEVGQLIGETIGQYALIAGEEKIDLAEIQEAWEAKLEPVLPYRQPSYPEKPEPIEYKVEAEDRKGPAIKTARPKALIPVFPGTNCEYDTARALRRAGADPEIFVIRNLTPEDVCESAKQLAERVNQSQMLIIPGGFSGGDEPEGSAKLINAFFRGPALSEAVTHLLDNRDGLILGICNGFQALIKLGLVPYGKITPPDENQPTLTFNAIGRHQSMLVRTRLASNLSPWLQREEVGAVHTIAVSHGEGRFVADDATLQKLVENGQIATQYIDLLGAPSMDVRFNPNASVLAVEGITSPDGRVFGKMGHTERSGNSLYVNVPGNKYQNLFESGVDYFTL